MLRLRLRARVVEERSRQCRREERVPDHFIIGHGDHPERGDHVRDDRIVRDRAARRQPTGNPCRQKRGLEPVADLVFAVE